MAALHCLLSASTPERLLCPRPSAGAVPPYPVLISRVGCRSWARSSWVLASCCMRRKWRAAPISSTVIMAGCVSSRVVTCGTSTSQGCHGHCTSESWGSSEDSESPQHRSTPSLHMIHPHPTGADYTSRKDGGPNGPTVYRHWVAAGPKAFFANTRF